MTSGTQGSAALLAYVASPHFRVHANVTARYLALLGFLHGQNAATFEAVLEIRGRNRRYFALSPGEIEAGTVHSYPQHVPGSPFWALTNLNNQQKQDVLRRILFALGHTQVACEQVVAALVYGFRRRSR